MNIKETFLDLTKETYPHGTEEGLFGLLPKGLNKDEFGNLFIEIGDKPSTMFTSHLDTASHDKKTIKHVIDGNIIRTDGTSILGADDKAGVTIMLYLIENKIPGLYYFFLGEERGCIGSKKVADKHRKEPLSNINKVISFDRRGTNSIITFQSSSRCCSEVFAESLADSLNGKSKQENSVDIVFQYTCDPTGIYTDSYQFMSIYPECTNISVGYQNEHTHRELQDIQHLEKLCKTVILVNWEDLPVERNPKIEERRYDRNNNYYSELGQDFWEYNYKKTKKVVENYKNVWFIDNDYENFISLIKLDSKGEVIQTDLSPERIEKERGLIKRLLEDINVGAESFVYDGTKLSVEHKVEYGGHETIISRNEIGEYIEELNFWKTHQKRKF